MRKSGASAESSERAALRPVQQQKQMAAEEAPPAKKVKLSAPVPPEAYKCAAGDAFTW
jgi:hypothetical protein